MVTSGGRVLSVTAIGETIEGDLATVVRSLEEVSSAALAAGATRVSVQLTVEAE